MIALALGDARYPARLRDLERPPDPLWVDGDVGVLALPAIAIVGTRRMTGYGERVARELAMACASSGVVVVSGFAQGIDTAAHRGALDGGGRTIAVLGESISVFLAAIRGRRRPLVPRVRSSGALVSEFATPFTAKTWTFVQRNATIAALAQAVVVVEAGERSGALITAEDARRLGRPLFAVPGPIGSAASLGTNGLIANRLATPLLRSEDALAAIGVRPAVDGQVAVDPLLAVLDDGALGLDELSRRMRLSPSTVASRIASLLLRGDVATLPDGRLRRTR